MIQNVSNGYYGYQNIAPMQNTAYSAPIFAMQPQQPAVDTVQFKGQQQPEEESFLSKNWGKLLIGGALVAGAVLTHGKLWGKAEEVAQGVAKGGDDAAKAAKGAESAESLSNAKPSHEPIISDMKPSKCNQFNPLPKSDKTHKQIVDDFIAERNVSAGEKPEIDLQSLQPHNYQAEESLTEIMTRGSADLDDYSTIVVNNANNTIALRPEELVKANKGSGKSVIGTEGDYTVESLSNGRKLVGIVVPTGRRDHVGRHIRAIINIVSKGTEFTPVQKDLIEIISQRKANKDPKNIADVLSFAMIDTKEGNGRRMGFSLNNEILLSSIATAKAQLKSAEIDKNFIANALALKDGEQLALKRPC